MKLTTKRKEQISSVLIICLGNILNAFSARVFLLPADLVAGGTTGIGLILMWIVFGVLHAFMPQKVPFDYTVFLGGAVGGCVAVLNFFFMGLAVQKAAAATDEDTARMRIKASYSQRMMIQMLWVIIAIVAPCFHFVAGIVPLLFPGTGIKIAGIFHTNK